MSDLAWWQSMMTAGFGTVVGGALTYKEELES